jgi:hypothetical protein
VQCGRDDGLIDHGRHGHHELDFRKVQAVQLSTRGGILDK